MGSHDNSIYRIKSRSLRKNAGSGERLSLGLDPFGLSSAPQGPVSHYVGVERATTPCEITQAEELLSRETVDISGLQIP